MCICKLLSTISICYCIVLPPDVFKIYSLLAEMINSYLYLERILQQVEDHQHKNNSFNVLCYSQGNGFVLHSFRFSLYYWQFLYQFKSRLVNKTYVHTKTQRWVFITALFVIAKSWKQSKCLKEQMKGYSGTSIQKIFIKDELLINSTNK